MLALELPTHFSSLPVMVFSWLLAIGTATIIFYTFLGKFEVKSLQQLAFFIPVSLLIFSFRQFEAVLGWFNCQWYLLAFGVVAALCLLEKSKSTDRWFGLSLLSAILASFSMLLGLLVWPAGLLQLLLASKWIQWKWRIAIWSITELAMMDCTSTGSNLPAGQYFEFPRLPEHWCLCPGLDRRTLSLGTSISRRYSWSCNLPHRNHCYSTSTRLKLIRKIRVWISMMVYAALAAVVTGFGRAGLGWGEFVVSRYTVCSVIGIIGLYLFENQCPIRKMETEDGVSVSIACLRS